MTPGPDPILWRLEDRQKRRNPPISQSKWNSYRKLVYENYIVQNKTLTAVLDMLAERSFHPSRRQLTAQLRRWEMWKNKRPSTLGTPSSQHGQQRPESREVMAANHVQTSNTAANSPPNNYQTPSSTIQLDHAPNGDIPALTINEIVVFASMQTRSSSRTHELIPGSTGPYSHLSNYAAFPGQYDLPFARSPVQHANGRVDVSRNQNFFDIFMPMPQENMGWLTIQR